MPNMTDRPKANSLRPLRSLLPFLRPHRVLLAGALVALVVAAAAMLTVPLALRAFSVPQWPLGCLRHCVSIW
jgi:ATP-binding cassette subfamily B protein